MSSNGPRGAQGVAGIGELAARQTAISEKWRREPAGLSAMGYGRVSKPADPANPNPTLAAMAAEAKQRGR